MTAHDDEDDRPVGFINVARDGGLHAFLLDIVVDPQVDAMGVRRWPVLPQQAAVPGGGAVARYRGRAAGRDARCSGRTGFAA